MKVDFINNFQIFINVEKKCNKNNKFKKKLPLIN